MQENKPTIDTPDFHALMNWYDNEASYGSLNVARNKLIAYIDAQLARQHQGNGELAADREREAEALAYGDAPGKNGWPTIAELPAVVAHIAAPAQAQPEGEAPQDVTCARCDGVGAVSSGARTVLCDACNGSGELRPAATLSPLCGAQHAESGPNQCKSCGGMGCEGCNYGAGFDSRHAESGANNQGEPK